MPESHSTQLENSMNPEKVTLVQDSFKKVAAIAETAADIFYQRLFEIAPEVRPLFPTELTDQKKKLMQTLTVAVNSLHEIESIVPTVKALGAKHVGYGVKDEHYDSVGAALLYTLEEGLGTEWNAELADAWTETYVILSTTMKEGAASARPVTEKPGLISRLLHKLAPASA